MNRQRKRHLVNLGRAILENGDLAPLAGLSEESVELMASGVCRETVKLGVGAFRNGGKYTKNLIAFLKAVPLNPTFLMFFYELDELRAKEDLLDCLVEQFSKDKKLGRNFAEAADFFKVEIKRCETKEAKRTKKT
jgi:hypothetical protein